MQVTLLFLIVALIFGLATCQMTFTDQWSKKRALMMNEKSTPSSDGLTCPSEHIADIFQQLERLQHVQTKLMDLLTSCYSKSQ